MNVKLLCEKSFSEDDREIVDRFVEFQEALIEANTDKLDEFILKTDEFVNLIGLQSKKEFISSNSRKHNHLSK